MDHPSQVLAESAIFRKERLGIELLAGTPPVVQVTWPSRPTLIPVPQYGNFLGTLFRVSGNSDAELRLLRTAAHRKPKKKP
jgi:hypothetical protein